MRWKLEVGSVGQIDNSNRQGAEATWTLTRLLAGATLTGFIVDSAGFLLLKIRPKNMSPPHTEKRRFFMAFGFWLLKGGNLTNQPISGSGGAHLLRDSTFLGPCTIIGGGMGLLLIKKQQRQRNKTAAQAIQQQHHNDTTMMSAATTITTTTPANHLGYCHRCQATSDPANPTLQTPPFVLPITPITLITVCSIP